VNQRLVICLGLSVIAGFSAAACVAGAGFGWIAAFASYSFVGSLSLVGFALAAHGLQTAAPARAKVERKAKSLAYA
jgi:hypothetical protein